MRSLNILMLAVGIVIIFLLGVIALVSAIYPAVLLNLGDFIAGPLVYVVESSTGRIISFLISVGIFGALVYYLIANIQASKRARTVVLQNPMGEVMVSLPAIEDFARVLKGKIEGLRDIKGRVVYTRKGLKVTARITVLSDYSIANVTEKVQEQIRTYIQKTLSIDQEILPTVIVTKVVARDKPIVAPGIKTSTTTTKGTTEIPLNKQQP
jgi:uncharacterized alkaline shock family protein YloU